MSTETSITVQLMFYGIVLLPHTVIPCQDINVKACPSTIEDWQIAAEAKNCSSNGCSKYELYHCVPNETGQLEEVCTPPLYLQGVCPYYDTVGERLQMGDISCISNDPCKTCTARYLSTSVHKYKVCFPSTEHYSFATSWIYNMENKYRVLCTFVLSMSLQFL